jgi:hypothetical protein
MYSKINAREDIQKLPLKARIKVNFLGRNLTN